MTAAPTVTLATGEVVPSNSPHPLGERVCSRLESPQRSNSMSAVCPACKGPHPLSRCPGWLMGGRKRG
jgi:hypothetical protein